MTLYEYLPNDDSDEEDSEAIKLEEDEGELEEEEKEEYDRKEELEEPLNIVSGHTEEQKNEAP